MNDFKDKSSIDSNSSQKLPSDYNLFYFVGIILVLFYFIILKVISSSDATRRSALKNLERS